MQETKVKKRKGLKVMKIIVAVILVIAIASVIFIEATTRPVKDTADEIIAVGGMVASDTIDYQIDSARGLEKNPVMKIMQMVWRFCYYGDKKKHESQTPPEVDEWCDIAYIDDANRYHRLDVYTKKGNTEKLPVIIDIHGGGWMYGDKELNKYYCQALADRGFTVFNISYRLVPDVTVNEQIQDVFEALKWIQDHLDEYPCDKESIMLTGDSAGGMLASYSAVILQSAELRETFGCVDPAMDVDALLLTSPVPDMKGGAMSVYSRTLWGKDYKSKATYEYMSLDKIIDYAENMPPTYLITSSGDSLANGQTHATYELMQEKGIESCIVDYNEKDYDGESLPHVFSVLFPFDTVGSAAIDDAIEFYKSTINNK